MDSRGWRRPRLGELGQEVRPGVGGLRSPGGQADQDGCTLGGDAPRREDGFGARTRVHLEERAVQEQVVQFDLGQGALGPGRELGLDRLAHPRHRRLAQRGLSAQRIGQGRLHITVRQPADVAGDDQRLQRIGAGHTGAEQPGGEPLGGAAQLRALQRDRPGGGLDHGWAEAVPTTLAGILNLRDTLVSGAAEELLHLCFHGGLDDQSGTQAGDLLEGLGQVNALTEQGMTAATGNCP